MTDHEWNDAHALSGAYAVDALDDLERARFEEHLSRCPACRAEVDGLREAAAVLGTEPVEPPAALRASVLAGIETIRPLPPLTGTVSVPDDEAAPRRRSWFRTAPLLVAAAFVLVALAATAWLQPWDEDEPDVALTATERVLTDPDAEHIVQEFPDGSSATVVVSEAERRAVILTEDMELAPEGKVYELWLQTPSGAMEPAGLMPDDPDATVLLDGDASRATAVGITVEPDGGSPEPTSDPIAVFAFTA